MQCIQCGASLISNSNSTPEEFARKFAAQDARIYGRTWSIIFLVGYFAFIALTLPELLDNRPWLLGGGALAMLLGRLTGHAVARHHNNQY